MVNGTGDELKNITTHNTTVEFVEGVGREEGVNIVGKYYFGDNVEKGVICFLILPLCR